MPVLIELPSALKHTTGGITETEVEATSIEEALQQFYAKFPEVRSHLSDEHGKLRGFVNVYVNDEDMRELAGLSTALKDGDTLSIIPAIAGGWQ